MGWIKPVLYEESKGTLRRTYDRIKGKGDYLDNIITIHGQRPHTLDGHMALYKNVLHHSANTLPKWELETIGVYVSLLNHCDYCVEHHFTGLRGLLRDDVRAEEIRTALTGDSPTDVFDARMVSMLSYSRQLASTPHQIEERHVRDMLEAGLTEGEVLEVNQVTAYFCYANRTVLGLGVTTDGDVLGLSPGDSSDPANWKHERAGDGA